MTYKRFDPRYGLLLRRITDGQVFQFLCVGSDKTGPVLLMNSAMPHEDPRIPFSFRTAEVTTQFFEVVERDGLGGFIPVDESFWPLINDESP
jgi:hypothetical protein